MFNFFKEKTYIFTFPSTNAKYLVQALNKRSAYKKFKKMLPVADDAIAKQFNCNEQK